MERIQRQFGKRFAQALSTSPTLVADLEVLRRRNFKIRKVKGTQAMSWKSKKLIEIGTGGTVVIKLLFLGHESYHVLKGTAADLNARVTREEYIEQNLEEETDCILHELQIAKELRAAGYTIDDETQLWERRFKRGGRAAVRRAMNKTFASGTRTKYPVYYGRQWDDAHPAKAA